MAFKEYAYKEVGGGESLLASVWYNPGASETAKPIGKPHSHSKMCQH